MLIGVFVSLVSMPKSMADTKWDLFIQHGRAFEPLRADPREGHFQLGILYGNKGLFEDIIAGGDLAMANVDFSKTRRLTISGRGIFTSRFNIFSKSFDLMNTDFIGGLATGLRWDDFSMEVFVFHQSSHLGDEILDRKDRKRIDFGYEAVRVLADWHWRFLRLYGGIKVTMHAYPALLIGCTILQAGFETRFTPGNVALFTSVDVQGRVDTPILQSLVVKFGVGLGHADSKRRLQYLFLQFFDGRSSMGQFYKDTEIFGMIGISYLLQ